MEAKRGKRANSLSHAAGTLSLLALAGLLLGVTPSPGADAAAEVRAALARWTADFNAGRTDKVCELFAKDARADVRGAPERDYAAICDLLVTSLQDKTRRYRYAVDIKEVLVLGDTAVVRLVWTLTVKGKDGAETQSVEPGMDIFHRQTDGSWKIIRYMAYER
jgi:steroid delta-isomerase